MKSRLHVLVSTAILPLLVQLAFAQAPLQPQPFSADMQFSSARGGDMIRDMSAKIYLGSGRMRMDAQGGPCGGVIIITEFKTRCPSSICTWSTKEAT